LDKFQGGLPLNLAYPSPSMAPEYMARESYDSVANQKGLSMRNAYPIIPPRPGTTGSDAESYEIKDYYARVESQNIQNTCGEIKDWKQLTYAIFENANESKNQCSYSFKVENSRVGEILAKVKALNPKDLSENTQTIKQMIQDFTSQVEILEKKRKSIDQTLDSALRSYDEITALATRTQNAEALAKIIDSKIGIIERLTQERININQQLDELARAKENQLDRLKYTYFNVSVFENKYFDLESLQDSWKAAVKDFVQTLNLALQSVTIGLLAFLVWLLPLAIYALIALLIVKYAWRAVRYIWTK